MKYVVLKHADKLPVVVLGLLISHDQLAAPWLPLGYKPASAGFVRAAGADQFETFGYSSSLQLTPNTGDAEIIRALYLATLKTAPAPAQPAGFAY